MNRPFVIPADAKDYVEAFSNGYRSGAIQSAIIRLEHGDTDGALSVLRGAVTHVFEGEPNTDSEGAAHG